MTEIQHTRFVLHADRLDDLHKQQDENVELYLAPEFAFDSGDEGYAAEEILQFALDQGVVTQPPETYLWLEFNPGRDGEAWHRFCVTLIYNKGCLVLAGPSDDYPPVRYGTKGREAVLALLEAAVKEGNDLLDKFDEVR